MTKTKWIAAGCYVLAVALGIVAVFTALFIKPVGASELSAERIGTTYYVSNDGSDDNDGKSQDTPFKTIQKLNGLEFKAGDAILFKRGDSFYDETFELHGNGTQDNPITVSAYGVGADPLIAARGTDKPCIYLNGNEGIEITDLELAESYQGISVEYDRDYDNKYLRFENLYIRDMMRSYNSSPAEYNHTSCGITVRANRETGSAKTVALENLIVRNINFYNCEIGFWGCWKVGKEFVPQYDVAIIKNVLLENLYIERGNMWGFSFTFMENVVVRNIVTRNTGLSPNNFGSCAVLFGFDKNVLIEKLDIDRHYRHTNQKFDACGLDFEGGNENITLRDSVIRNTDGCGLFLTYNTEQAIYDFLMEDCTIANFGLNDGGSNQGCAVLVFDNDGHPNYSTGTIRNCTFINSRTSMTVPFYKNSSPYIVFENCKTYYDTNWTYDFEGEGNTMTFEHYSSVDSLTAANGLLKADFATDKNYISTPDYIKLDAKEGRTLKIRLKNNSDAEQVKLQFTKDSDIQFDDTKSLVFDISARDVDFKEYAVDLSDCSAWRSFVRQLRFTFVGANSGGAEIDYIKVLTVDSAKNEDVLNTDVKAVSEFSVFGAQTMTENADGSLSVTGTAAWRYGISSNRNVFLNTFSTKVKFDSLLSGSNTSLSVVLTRLRHGWYTDAGNNVLAVVIQPQSSNMRVDVWNNSGRSVLQESKTINGKPTETFITVSVTVEDNVIKVNVNEAEFLFTDDDFDISEFSRPMFIKYGLTSDSQTATGGFTVANINYGNPPLGYGDDAYGAADGLESALDSAFGTQPQKDSVVIPIVFTALAGAAAVCGIAVAFSQRRKTDEKK